MFKYILTLIILFVGTQGAAGEVRLAIDVGSQAIQVAIAEVEVEGEEPKVVKHLYEASFPLAISVDVRQSGTRVVTDRVKNTLLQIFSAIDEEAKKKKVEQYAAVATGGLRQARNAERVMEELAQERKLHLHLISDEEEARLAFLAGRAAVGVHASYLVVWDLGGDTMEIVTQDSDSGYLYASSPLGSGEFMHQVIRQVKRENPQVVNSANPLNQKEVNQAVDLAKKEAKKLPQALREKMHAPSTLLVGIGNLAFLDLDQVGPRHTLASIWHSLEARVGKKDQAFLHALYPGQVVTNLCLVVGFMEEMGINQITLEVASLADGLLLQNQYWQPFPHSESPSKMSDQH